MKKTQLALSAIAAIGLSAFAASASAVTIFSEDFDGITTGYTSESCGLFCSHNVANGVPTSGGGSTVNGGADEDWFGARFEQPEGGTIISDIGAQDTGGPTSTGDNLTPVGLVQDDAGLMFKLNTTGLTNITLTFDWRLFATESGDTLRVGYFVGDLDGLGPTMQSDRTIDLRPLSHGGADGIWNWGLGWNELLAGTGTGSENWHFGQSYNLTLADNAPEVWVAFWLDNGNKDNGKIDNVTVTATVVPVPPAVWLFGTGLLGLIGVARRRKIA